MRKISLFALVGLCLCGSLSAEKPKGRLLGSATIQVLPPRGRDMDTSFQDWADGWVMSTRILRTPYRDSQEKSRETWLYPWLEIYTIELEMPPEQRKEFWALVNEDYRDNFRRSEAEAKNYLIARMKKVLGIAKYNQFIFLIDTERMVQAPPRDKSLYGINYERIRKHVEYNERRPEHVMARKRLEKSIDSIAARGNLTAGQRQELLQILWKERMGTSEIEGDMGYLLDSIMFIRARDQEPLVGEKSAAVRGVLQRVHSRLDEIRKVREVTKEKIKTLLSQNQQRVFEELTGWNLK